MSKDNNKQDEIKKVEIALISTISHQLRTPLSGIKWFLEMLMKGNLDPKKQKELLHDAHQSNERMIILVNDLLNISKVKSGQLLIDPKATDIFKLTKDIISEITPTIKRKGTKIELIKPSKSLAKTNTDPELIRQVIINLISNAIKYCPKGLIKIEITPKEKGIQFKISDNGVGIPKSQQKKIFEEFFRADNAIEAEIDGSGLGLYLSKCIIEASGGKIWFDSKTKKETKNNEHGSCFYFTLPPQCIKWKRGKGGQKLIVKDIKKDL
ncbi:MAG: HAMP domain-containing sensor histidine kinase [Candidatus Peregrinibacteria bacterium]|nr:HAMP domain-containing sensor histidine kinase [Candidatus Peregrinibacteria bacterium]MDZ4244388.1 HAMP domain-containing sensor histidine kinase [Candidatus Gracilibacteria bacterium]